MFCRKYDNGLMRINGNTCLFTAQRMESDKTVRRTFPMRYEVQTGPP